MKDYESTGTPEEKEDEAAATSVKEATGGGEWPGTKAEVIRTSQEVDASSAPTGMAEEANKPLAAEQQQPKVRLLDKEADHSREGDNALPAQEASGRDGLIASSAPEETGSFYGINYLHKLKNERPRSGDCTVIFHQSAYRQVVEHLRQDVKREHGGLLLGYEMPGPTAEETKVFVSKVLPAQHTLGTPSRLTFTEDTWAEFANQTESLVGTNLRRVGWYHSHPNFGIFLSPFDIDVCSNFQRSTHLALVYDPIRHEGGFFVNGTKGYNPKVPQGFWEYCDLTAHSIVDWGNAELVSGVSVEPSEYDLAKLDSAWKSYRGSPDQSIASGSDQSDSQSETHDERPGYRKPRRQLRTFTGGFLLGAALVTLVAVLYTLKRERDFASDRNGLIAQLNEAEKRLVEKPNQINSMPNNSETRAVTSDKVPQDPSANAGNSGRANSTNSGQQQVEASTQARKNTPRNKRAAGKTSGDNSKGNRKVIPLNGTINPGSATQPGNQLKDNKNKPSNTSGNVNSKSAPSSTQPPKTGGNNTAPNKPSVKP